MTFDPIGAAQTAAQQTLDVLLDPERAARLAAAAAQDPQQLGLAEVLDQLWAVTWKAAPKPAELGSVQRAVDDVALTGVMALAANPRLLRRSGQWRC